MKIKFAIFFFIFISACGHKKNNISLTKMFFQLDKKDSIKYFIDEYNFEKVKFKTLTGHDFYRWSKQDKDTTITYYPSGTNEDVSDFCALSIINFDSAAFNNFEKVILANNSFDTIFKTDKGKIYSKYNQYQINLFLKKNSLMIHLNYLK